MIGFLRLKRRVRTIGGMSSCDRGAWHASGYTTVTNRLIRFGMSALIGAVFIAGLVTMTPVGRATAPRPDAKAILRCSCHSSDLRGGTPYYTAMGAELRGRGYPARSVFNWRTPLHLEAVASVGIPSAHMVIRTLGVMLVAAAAWALSVYGPETALLAAFSALGAAAPLLGFPGPVVFGEAWCGALIGLSLASYTRRCWTAAATCGVAAVFLRELAAPCSRLRPNRLARAGVVSLQCGSPEERRTGVLRRARPHMAMRPDDIAHAVVGPLAGPPVRVPDRILVRLGMLAPNILVPLLVAAGHGHRGAINADAAAVRDSRLCPDVRHRRAAVQ